MRPSETWRGRYFVDARASADLLQKLLLSLEHELPDAIRLRERLHAAEPRGARYRRLVVEALGVQDVERVLRTGLMAQVGPPGEAVAVRAELDALPIEEETGVPFAATSGSMHACGHDVHMAALVALFRAAGRIAGSLPKPLLAFFQPSEEAYNAKDFRGGQGRPRHPERAAPPPTLPSDEAVGAVARAQAVGFAALDPAP